MVSNGWCWLVLVGDVGVQTDFGFSFDATPTIDMVLFFRESNGDRPRRQRRLKSMSSGRTS